MRSLSLESDTRDPHPYGATFVPCNMNLLRDLKLTRVCSTESRTTCDSTNDNESVSQTIEASDHSSYYQYYVGDQTPKRKKEDGISHPLHTLSPFIFKQERRKPIATRRYGSPLSPIDTSISSLIFPELPGMGDTIDHHEVHEIARNTPITPLSPWSHHELAYSPTESPSTVIYPVSESREHSVQSPSNHTHRVRSPVEMRPIGVHSAKAVHGRPILKTVHLNLTHSHRQRHQRISPRPRSQPPQRQQNQDQDHDQNVDRPLRSVTPVVDQENRENQETKQRIEYLQNAPITVVLKENLTIPRLIEMDLVHKFIIDQSGSRYLQSLMSVNREQKGVETKEMKESVSLMIKYCVEQHMAPSDFNLTEINIAQILFVEGSEKEQALLLDTFLSANVLRLSKSIYGCRVIQKCLVTAKNKAFLRRMVRSFDKQTHRRSDSMTATKEEIHEALLDPYANHVIQAMLDLKLDCDSYVLFIKKALEREMAFYGEHVFGCRIIQCFIKNYGDKLDVMKLIGTRDDHLYLSKTKYGNYVIQCIIEKGKWYSMSPRMIRFRNRLIEDISRMQQILILSKNKFGSNVMETCIRVATRKQKSVLFWEVMDHSNRIPMLIKHCYGNYVVKALLVESHPKHQVQFMKAILKWCPTLRSSDDWKFAKDIIREINRIEKERQSIHN